MSNKQTAWDIYREELFRLETINRAHDFSETGEQMYQDQYEKTRDAYLAACQESEAQALGQAEELAS